MKRYLLLLGCLLGLAVFAGCSTPQTRIRQNPELFNNLAPGDQELIKQGKVAVGFTPEMVKLAVGDPDRVYTRTDATGKNEAWVYTSYTSHGGTMVYYRGFYHRRHPGMYAYFADYNDREVVERYRVTFKEGKVASIEEMSGD
ncbi:MAG TPA: hypothetical protein PK322_07125 [Opitutaceae bacterium]|nr:hypothetical protein [Opitutaceae bacterium]